MQKNPGRLQNLKHVHPIIKCMFSENVIETPLAGRIKQFLQNWQLITNDPVILNIVKGWEIPLNEQPIRSKLHQQIHINKLEEKTTDLEIESMLKKGAIRLAIPKKDQILSNIFLTPKKGGEFLPVINLKELNKFIPYQHFKMEGLKDVRNLLQRGDLMCKLDLKDAYFSVPLSTKSRKQVRFRWKGNLYEFLCLAFGLAPAPRIFTKLMKVPISILRRINIRLVIYLDDMLLMATSLSDILMARDSAMFLFHHLGLIVNMKKSVLTPQKEIEFLGILVNSQEMTFSLPREKIESLKGLCQNILTSKQITLRELSSLVGKLRATAPAVIPAPLQLRYLQQVLVRGQQKGYHYETMISLTQDCVTELKWWINNINLQKGKPLVILPPDLVIQSDAAKTGGWGAATHNESTGGMWKREEMKLHINILELLAAELAIRTFTKERRVSSIHLQIDNTVALSYLIKMGGTKNTELTKISKRIWHYLLDKEITLTAEWIPSHLNVMADWESRNVEDSTEWKLSPQIFTQICQMMGVPNVDLFASRVSHQIQTYMSLKSDPQCLAIDAFRQNWEQYFPYAFPPFCLISKVLRQVSTQSLEKMIIITPLWPTQPWYPLLLSMSIQQPILLPNIPNLLTNPLGQTHPLIQTTSLDLVAWMVSGRPSLTREFRDKLENSSSMQEERVPYSIMSQPGKSGICGVVENKLIHLNVL